MLTYLLVALWAAGGYGVPIQQDKTGQIVYYTPTSSNVVSNGLYHPFLRYSSISPVLGKALESNQSPNDLLFYPNLVQIPAQPIIVNAQPETLPITKFTASQTGLIDSVYAWFADNNVPLPEEPNRNEPLERIDSLKDQEKIENPDKPPIAGEAEVLAEADKNPTLNFPKKPITPNLKPGQKVYILNGQPQFYSTYQPVQPIIPQIQPVIPQLLTKATLPTDNQNFLLLQPQQTNLKNIQASQQDANQHNIVLFQPTEQIQQSNIQQEIKPVNYHGTNLKPQNFVLLREAQQSDNLKPIVQNYPQQYILGRYLPNVNNIKQQQLYQQQVAQNPIHQTHYVPVEVVPPQVPVQDTQVQQDSSSSQLQFIHIPVDRNVQLPQYIKQLVPVRINHKSQTQDIPIIPLQNRHQQQQQHSEGKQVLYLSPEVQQGSVNVDSLESLVGIENRNQNQQALGNIPPGIAALEFARYFTKKQNDFYSDTVVIDAKTDDEHKEDSELDGVQADIPQEPSMAQAQPGGIALAGPGGIAATAPRGTALVGEKGLAVASPHATAVAGTNIDKSGNKPNNRN